MSVTRIHEDPRVTKPYTELQWQAIEKLGHRIDAELEAGAVRLTMGGEPTFVSIDDMDGLEWNSTAVGLTKRILAAELLRRLHKRFAPGGLLHYGQAKWYPGEPLPRWALSCHWRRDGEPIWQDLKLIADESVHYGYGPAEAEYFISTLARRLGIGGEMDDSFRLTKTSGTTCGKSAGYRQMSIPWIRRSTMRPIGPAWPRYSSKVWTISSATPCR